MTKHIQHIVYFALLLPFVLSMAVNTYGLPNCLELSDQTTQLEMSDEESSEDSLEDLLFVESLYEVHFAHNTNTPWINLPIRSIVRVEEVIDPPPELN